MKQIESYAEQAKNHRKGGELNEGMLDIPASAKLRCKHQKGQGGSGRNEHRKIPKVHRVQSQRQVEIDACGNQSAQGFVNGKAIVRQE